MSGLYWVPQFIVDHEAFSVSTLENAKTKKVWEHRDLSFQDSKENFRKFSLSFLLLYWSNGFLNFYKKISEFTAQLFLPPRIEQSRIRIISLYLFWRYKLRIFLNVFLGIFAIL